MLKNLLAPHSLYGEALMNKYQRLIIVSAVLNILMLLLFPPFSSQPLARIQLSGFEGFYPIFTQFGRLPIYTELLAIQLMYVGANALFAWLLLTTTAPQQGSHTEPGFGRAILALTIANLLLVLAFPPYESFLTLMHSQAGFFEGFYFVLGTNYRRTIMWPLLQLECLFIVVNALAHYLVFSVISDVGRKQRALRNRQSPTAELEKITEDLRRRAKDKHHKSPNAK